MVCLCFPNASRFLRAQHGDQTPIRTGDELHQTMMTAIEKSQSNFHGFPIEKSHSRHGVVARVRRVPCALTRPKLDFPFHPGRGRDFVTSESGVHHQFAPTNNGYFMTGEYSCLLYG